MNQPNPISDFWNMSVDTMLPSTALILLQRYALRAAKEGHGNIVEIGAYRGGSTIALAKGLCEAGRGKVTSIDPHQPSIGMYGGKFSREDHSIYLGNLERLGVAPWVNHLCTDSQDAAKDWTSPIDLLWVDGDHRYEAVARDITLWAPFVRDRGFVIFDDVEAGSEIDEAIRDHFPFSQFRLIEKEGKVAIFRKEVQPRTLFLCGGMQSSGSTLVSWCFLQRHDLDGIFDMENALIQQDFSCIHTESVWLKMTIGSFRLAELVSLYEAQGWVVKPLLVHRDLASVYRSLKNKPYGFDGATGDEPPIYIRIQRYQADLEAARARGWPILNYEDLILNPRNELQRVCDSLNLAWDEAMMTWPKDEAAISYMANGNPTFHGTKQGSAGLLESIDKFRKRETQLNPEGEQDFIEDMLAKMGCASIASASLSDKTSPHSKLLSPVQSWGTRRKTLEREFKRMSDKLNITEYDLNRIKHHVVFGRLLRLWKRFINNTFPAGD